MANFSKRTDRILRSLPIEEIYSWIAVRAVAFRRKKPGRHKTECVCIDCENKKIIERARKRRSPAAA